MVKTTFWGITTAIILSSLVIYGFFNGLNILTIENQATETFYGDALVKATSDNLQGNSSNYLSDANKAKNVLGNSSVSQGGVAGQNQVFNSVSKLWNGIIEKPIAIYNVVIEIGQKRIFGDFTIISVFAGLLTLALIIAIIRMVTTGEGGGRE